MQTHDETPWAMTIIIDGDLEERCFTTLYEAVYFIYNAEKYNQFGVEEIITPNGRRVKIYAGEGTDKYTGEFITLLDHDELAISFFHTRRGGMLR